MCVMTDDCDALSRDTGGGVFTAQIAKSANSSSVSRTGWLNGPFLTNGKWITDASGLAVTYAGVNLPGHVETMIPEGLQYQSVSDVVSMVKSIGMNSIRLTCSIEMIDQIEENGGRDIAISAAFVNALGQENGTSVFEKKAGWCCTPVDGNTWWGDTYFPVGNWTRGLSYKADHGKQWSNLMSMSLRNELRQPILDSQLFSESYNWQDWYKYVKEGVLIFLSGLDSDTTLQPVVQRTALTPGSSSFNREDFPADKLVLELHNYANILGSEVNNCAVLQQKRFQGGFQALQDGSPNIFPVVMTEYGFQQDATTWQGTFAACLQTFLADLQAGWTIWALPGSYYIRRDAQDANEPWGLLTHDWSGWRSPEHINGSLAELRWAE
ncbi:glycoside hydrolase superfamily [Truncatella angustata]|uniref:Glycoside hydrolase superfamily n=1 Tax=Truncatella angustata TaxID=152316 RepID=A0A9P8UFX3_9PEZI|nr:glycoside hydrolase superfamily [Truncatella angustata]KAH6649182.1 glycoside hydrolase superfamily [Truncatella angustata]